MPGIDRFIPVDVYIPGCPPTPQSLINGLMTLQKLIQTQSLKTVRWYTKEPNQPIPVPVLGPDLMDPRQYDLISMQNEQIEAPAEVMEGEENSHD